MKRLLLFPFLVFIFSCKKENTSLPPNQNPNYLSGRFSFKTGAVISGSNTCTLGTLNNFYVLTFGGGTQTDNITITIKMPTNSVVKGQYNTLDGTTFMEYRSLYNINSWEFYEADTLSEYKGSKINYDITEYNDTTKYVKCNFSGTLSSGHGLINITNGTIDGVVVKIP